MVLHWLHDGLIVCSALYTLGNRILFINGFESLCIVFSSIFISLLGGLVVQAPDLFYYGATIVGAPAAYPIDGPDALCSILGIQITEVPVPVALVTVALP